jgi:hypothetical protein
MIIPQIINPPMALVHGKKLPQFLNKAVEFTSGEDLSVRAKLRNKTRKSKQKWSRSWPRHLRKEQVLEYCGIHSMP